MDDRSLALNRLAAVVSASSVESPLSLRMSAACASILGVDGASLTLGYGDLNRVTLCSTDEFSARLEDVQEVIGQGPSYDAYRHRTIVTTYIDGAADQRWPLFSDAAKRALGACNIYAFPIKPGPHTMGVATFYQMAESALSIDAQVGQFLVNAVGVALVTDPDVLDEDRLTKEESWVTHARTHQATGMVMAQLRLGDDDALALIRAHAYAHNTTLAQICDEILQRHLDFTTTDRGPG
jgi:hypothetical protein